MTWATKMMDAIRADDKDVAVQAFKMSGFNIDEQLQVRPHPCFFCLVGGLEHRTSKLAT